MTIFLNNLMGHIKYNIDGGTFGGWPRVERKTRDAVGKADPNFPFVGQVAVAIYVRELSRHYALIVEIGAFENMLRELGDHCRAKKVEKATIHMGIESDCETIVSLLNSQDKKSKPPKQIEKRASDVKAALETFPNVKVVHIYRKANRIANYLATTTDEIDDIILKMCAMLVQEQGDYPVYRLPPSGNFIYGHYP
ncbi:hypothetical protein CCACVL1_25631 [Corchorus capsularis]|uniref:RNase H type-1 domain-containing protein n=1 Tax=Corchorus capsularis TaxID=210143 RepID=A0A1R3GIP9_COCAP|nr:hypothetical protein CCACVL1_25631 [Corchorus capsularis]